MNLFHDSSKCKARGSCSSEHLVSVIREQANVISEAWHLESELVGNIAAVVLGKSPVGKVDLSDIEEIAFSAFTVGYAASIVDRDGSKPVNESKKGG